jgi:hypothetical protein
MSRKCRTTENSSDPHLTRDFLLAPLGLPSCKTPVLMHKSFPLPNIKAYAKVGEDV